MESQQETPKRPLSPSDITPIVVEGSEVDAALIPQISLDNFPINIPGGIKSPSPTEKVTKKEFVPRAEGIPLFASPPAPPPPPKPEPFIADGVDINTLNSEQTSAMRARYISRIGILRDTWPTYGIPIPTESQSLRDIISGYNEYVRHIAARNSTDQFRLIIVFLWLFSEYILVRWLKVTASGFTLIQMKTMNKYEQLLIELGEKNSVESFSSWPVEIKLIGMTLLNIVIFVGIKMIAGGLNDSMVSSIMELISGMITTPSRPNGQGNGIFNLESLVGLASSWISGQGNPVQVPAKKPKMRYTE